MNFTLTLFGVKKGEKVKADPLEHRRAASKQPQRFSSSSHQTETSLQGGVLFTFTVCHGMLGILVKLMPWEFACLLIDGLYTFICKDTCCTHTGISHQ